MEEDPELASKINLYKRKSGAPAAAAATTDAKDEDMDADGDEDDGFPQISMDQLLDDMGNVQIGYVQ